MKIPLIAYESFWQKHPALLYGIALTLGCMLALGAHWEAAGIWILMLIPLIYRPTKPLLCRLAMAFVLSLCMLTWIQQKYSFPLVPEEGIKGHGTVSISSVTQLKHTFGNRFIYRGTLLYFIQEKGDTPLKDLKNIPITVSIPNKDDLQRPPADNSYLIQGILKKTKNGGYILQVPANIAWVLIDSTPSLAESRYQLKMAVAENIRGNYRSPQSQGFLAGIATGSFDDRLMASDFGRFGLQHIMAISGFHFAIIAAFFSLILSLLLPKRPAVLGLVFFLSCYFLFLGVTASIMRAWIMCLIAVLALLFERKPYALNSLGIALGAVLIYDPLQIHNLGFQFSFATTASILLLYSPLDNLLQKAFKKRTLSQALSLSLTDKYAYILLSIIRQGFALAIAVNLAAMPLTMHYFQKFPLMSLLFNLFFPFSVSISMILLILGFAFLPIPWLGSGIHSLNDAYTQIILNLITYTPKTFDIYIRTSDWQPWMTISIITLLFTIGIYSHSRQDEQKLNKKDWLFV